LELKDKIAKKREETNDKGLKEVVGKGALINFSKDEKFKIRRTLKGHCAKIYALHWGDQTPHQLVSAAGDGQIIVWNAMTTHKLNCITVRSNWVMACAYSPSGNFVACGGLDNLVSIYHVKSKEIPIKISRELSGHNGFVSFCRFLNDKQILSSSADGTCMLWDIESGTCQTTFKDPLGSDKSDIMSLSLCPTDSNVFVTGGIDQIARVWDIRTKKYTQQFSGHQGDINSVAFFPNGRSFATGSEDKTCKLYDIRADRELMSYSHNTIESAVATVAFSSSGRFLFGGYDDFNVFVWDTLTGDRLMSLQGHTSRVSCLGVAKTGYALCTGSWDMFLKVWC